MAHPVHVDVRPDRIVVLVDTPGRLRGAAFSIGLGLVALGLFHFDLWWTLVSSEGLGLAGVLLELARTWWVLALAALFAVLLVLDGRSRRKVVWTGKGVRTSWLFGPVELFAQFGDHRALPPLQLREDAAGAKKFFLGDRGAWSVGWPMPDRAKPGRILFSDLARFATREEAQALSAQLLTWSPAVGGGFVAVDDVTAASQAADVGVQWLLRMPLVALLGAALAVIGLAGEAIAVHLGRVPAVLPWDAVADAELVRFAVRADLEPREMHTARGVEQLERAVSSVQAEVRFRDGRGEWRVRPLAPLGEPASGARPLLRDVDGGPSPLFVGLAGAGWVPPRLAFELPRRVLDVPSDDAGAFRFAEARTEPDADVYSRGFQLHWNILARIDAPADLLPLHWTEPTLASTLRIVYRMHDGPDAPVWLADEAEAHLPLLQDFNGMVYVMALPALILGSLAFFALFPGRSDLLRGGAWLLVLGSAWWWGPRATLPEWMDIDRGLQARMRATLLDWHMAQPAPRSPLGADVLSGVWLPENSRYAGLLAELDLLRRPEQPAADVAAARMAIALRARQRLDALDPEGRERLLRQLPARQLLREANSWLVGDVIAPGVCAWLRQPDSAGLVARHAGVLRDLECRLAQTG